MRITIINLLSVILLSLSLCSCGSNVINSLQEVYPLKTNFDSEKSSVLESAELNLQPRLNYVESNNIIYLNNKATLYEGNLYIKAMYTNLIFTNVDETGNYHSWQFPEEILFEASRAYRYFKYSDKLVCLSHVENGNDEILIFDSNLKLQKRKTTTSFNPQYLSGSILYGYGVFMGYSAIKTIDLETWDEKIIHISNFEKQAHFIINDKDEMIISEPINNENKGFYLYKSNNLEQVLENPNMAFVYYDSRGLFYLSQVHSDSKWNLILWDGDEHQLIGEIKTDDMDEWLFLNGLSGNIIIEKNCYITIHTLAEKPYLLIHSFNSKESRKIQMESWDYAEGDIERAGETFSGINYENGQIMEYFFSEKLGLLQTKIINIQKFL